LATSESQARDVGFGLACSVRSGFDYCASYAVLLVGFDARAVGVHQRVEQHELLKADAVIGGDFGACIVRDGRRGGGIVAAIHLGRDANNEQSYYWCESELHGKERDGYRSEASSMFLCMS
jgi:hypothetical protein